MSDAKRKPSGSEFKKRRLNKQTQLQKKSDALQNFLKEDMPRNELLAHCKDLEVVLTDGNSSDLKALELADEISIVSKSTILCIIPGNI
ncbi:hypothetical protein Avbf_02305 [Armadillidium vulgare]|nr:hypothetical protein Avbf_02305 [Armadillidium vulgare]